jgi:Rhodopirellula transposase DDE domain
MKHDTAGDPMTGLKWTRRTTAKLAAELSSLGIKVSARTVARLLKQMRFSLRTNRKMLCGNSPEERDAQFGRIAELRDRFASHGLPIISVDTKKKEMVGLFKNPGLAWTQEPVLVNDHDFRSDAKGMVVPYGVYDTKANRGTLFVGTSHDTPYFAVDAIEKWWRTEGRIRYPDAQRIAVLADAGGSNGPTCRAWKHGLKARICNRHGLTVTVAHYPTGASKWNPIEHRLFSEISKNWAGRPLDTYETILNYIRTTRTTTGLRVRAHLVRRYYKKEVRITDAEMQALKVAPSKALPKWNYTLRPA